MIQSFPLFPLVYTAVLNIYKDTYQEQTTKSYDYAITSYYPHFGRNISELSYWLLS